MNLIKIYGERNSGTIFLEWLLKKNLSVNILETHELGWKHRLAPEEAELSEFNRENVIFLCLVKNPYSWLLSMHKRPYNHESLKNLSFLDFVTYSYGDYRNPVIMWNKKNRSYLDMAGFVSHHEMVKYEDILQDSSILLNKITEKYDISRPPFYKSVSNLLTNSHGIKQQKFHKEYYLNELWIKKLRDEHIERINQFIDKDLMEKFNYSIL
jgi:hypothetical protein